MQTVQGCHHIAVLCLSVFIRKFIEIIARDGYNMGRVIYIHFLFVIKAIDHLLDGTVHFLFILGSCPEKNISVFRPHRFHLTYLCRGFVIYEIENGR